ncbi:MAG: DUF4358 domain-containing protein [Ruminococcus sp.]|nr:DUF4358 domain-containing protein [Ruminococcus sp.]
MNRKLLSAALAAALLLAGCGSSESSSEKDSSAPDTQTTASQTSPGDASVSTPEESEAPASALAALADDLKAADPDRLNGSAAYGERLLEKNCKKLYSCEVSELSDALIVYNNGGGYADEVSVIERTDGDKDKAVAALKSRIDLRRSDFENYKPDQLDKINAGRVFTVGSKAVLIISDSAEALEKLIKEKLS